VELFPEVQENSLNFIMEGCMFRGNLEIPTTPPVEMELKDMPRKLQHLPP
jgi:hypothetical protein